MARLIGISGMVLLVLAGPAPAFHHKETIGLVTLEARSEPDRPTLSLADVLRVIVTIEGAKELRVEAPVGLVAKSGWEVIASAIVPIHASEDGRPRWRQALTLAPAGLGEQKVELTPLSFRDGESEAQTVAFKPFTISIVTQIKDLDIKHTRDITSTEDLPAPPDRPILPWLGLAFVPVAVLAVVAAWLLLRRPVRRRPATVLEKAMRECDRVTAMKLNDRGHAKTFVILLTGIVRRFLERRFDIPARRQTTAELLRAIDAHGEIGDDAKRWLRDFFENADLVKFAAADVGAERCADLMQEVRRQLAACVTR